MLGAVVDFEFFFEDPSGGVPVEEADVAVLLEQADRAVIGNEVTVLKIRSKFI